MQLNCFSIDPQKMVMRYLQFFFCCFIIASFSSCGIFSLQQEAIGSYVDALNIYSDVMRNTSKPANPSQQNEKLEFAASDLSCLKESSNLVEKSIAIDPLFIPAHKLAIDLAILLKEQEKADLNFKYALSLFPDDIFLRLGYVRFLTATDANSDEILSVLNKGLLRDPLSPALRMASAQINLGLDQNIEGIEDDLFILLKTDDLPDNIYTQIGLLVFILAEKNYYDTAGKILIKLTNNSPESVKTAVSLVLQEDKGEIVEKLFSHSLDRYSPSNQFYPIWIRILIFRRKFAEAESLLSDDMFLSRFSSLDDESMIKSLQGFLLLEQGKAGEAKKIFESILEGDGDNIDALEGYFNLFISNPDKIDLKVLVMRFRKAIQISDNPKIRMHLAERLDFIQKKFPNDS